jgi:TRAP-type C4-dicarboxylate transport system permease small subunit
MSTVRKLAANFEEVFGATLLAAMCICAIIQVAGRYLLAAPPAWTEELATLLFAWLAFVGASLALKRHEHFALEVAVEQLPRNVQHVVRSGVLVLVLLFCVLLVYHGAVLSLNAWTTRTAVLEVPRTWLYAAVPFGGGLMCVRTIQLMIRHWADWRAELNAAGEAS